MILIIINKTIVIAKIIIELIADIIAVENTAPKINPKTTANATNNIASIYSPQQRFLLFFIQHISS